MMECDYAWTATADDIHLTFCGGQLPVEKWERLEDTDHAARWWLLRELLDNGQATEKGNYVSLSHAEAVRLDETDQQLLTLPTRYPFEICVRSVGTLNQNEFRYDIEFFVQPGGERLLLTRTGSVLYSDEAAYLLGEEQLAFCQAVASFHADPEISGFEAHAHIKDLAQEADVVLDKYLTEEEVIVPDQIEVDLDLDGDDLLLNPRIRGVENDTLQRRFRKFPKVMTQYRVRQDDGKSARVVFSDDQSTALDRLKSHQRVSKEDHDALLNHPETVLDPDIFDLDAFSERVVELGLHKPTFYPFVAPYKSQWIPGVVVETSPEDRREIQFDTEERLDRFETELRQARLREDDHVSWEDVDIPVEDAEQVVRTARRQWKDPSQPAAQRQDDSAGEASQAEETVLIIRGNVQEDEYSEVGEAPATEQFDHLYQPPPHLMEPYAPRRHQKEGIAWMQTLFTERYPGGLLADDMGLGKTFQVLSFIKWHHGHPDQEAKPYLVVAPVALLENWAQEYHKFFDPGALHVRTLHGQALRDIVHGNVADHWRKGANQLEAEGSIILTTYGSLRKYQLLFAAVDWGVAVLDEAQKIKNPSTQVTNAAKALKAEFKLPMTGTPVENSLVDLWSLMDFAVPGLLGSAKNFAAQYQKPLKDEDTDVKALGASLRDQLGVYIKRRLKKQVAKELPSKTIHHLPRPMPPTQAERYRLEIEQVQQAKRSGSSDGREVLRALHAMRIISDHPYLADRQIQTISANELAQTSAKLSETVELLHVIHKQDEKAILYADRKVTQRMLSKVLREVFGLPGRIINGDTPAGNTGSRSKKTRQELINQFEANDGFGALVMSPIAAGVGLNITAANHVIHYARHWNPAKEDQATDRVYRIGQTKDVHVYYPMCTIPGAPYPSFDQTLDDLLERKRKLADASLFPSERAEVSPDDLYESVFDRASDEASVPAEPITIETALTLDPYVFEALVAVLWKHDGTHVHLTPRQRDRGADIVVYNDQNRDGALIQVKQQSSTVGPSPVREIYSARAFYEDAFNIPFNQLMVITSADKYTSGARELAHSNDVTLLARADLAERLHSFKPTLRDVRQQERTRMDSL